MKYLYWENTDEFDILPLKVYEELDEKLYETRKVEVYLDNVLGYADEKNEFGRTGLSDRPLPKLEDMVKLIPSVIEISKKSFEKIWGIYAR
jgi:hypothetical protein